MDDEQRRTLLLIAREAIAADLTGASPPALREDVSFPACGGVFVSLHRGRLLRGCIGTFQPEGALPMMVQRMAVEAAHDPRFVTQPITAQELPEINIEISVLSEMQRTNDPLSLELGRHGIYIRRGYRAGCFLPQVASADRGWTREQFLSHCCHDKAGLAADAWRDPTTEVYLFTAEVFSEHSIPTRPCT